jgi:indoleacetamide hydrolase
VSSDLSQLGATEVLSAFASGSLSARDYAENLLNGIGEADALNVISDINPENLIEQAKASDERRQSGKAGLLEGLPLILKENINTSSLATAAGTKALAGFVAKTDAPAASALRNQGGIIGAKAKMHELAFGITSNNSCSGPVRNPYDKKLIPGGSSGGTAAAIAARLFPVGLGTDTGGSCRIPAALCGIVGFRPTTGRYNSSAVVPISHSRDTVGPLARSVADVSLLDSVLAGDLSPGAVPTDLSKVRLGKPKTRFYEDLEPAVLSAVERSLAALEAAGATIIEFDFPEIWEHNDAFSFPVVFYEVMRDLPSYLSEYASDVAFDDLLAGIASPDVKGALESQLGDGAMPKEAYEAAINVHRPAMREIYNSSFEQHSLNGIIFPTTPLRARPIGQDETVELNGALQPTFPTYIRNTDLGSNLGAPGISLPCGLEGGLPVGIEIDGIEGGDEALLSLASAVEEVLTPLPAPSWK